MEVRLFDEDVRGWVDLDPRTKLLIVIVSSAAALNAFRPIPLLVFGSALCAVVAVCGKPGLALRAWCGLGLGIYLRHMVDISGVVSAAAVVISAVITLGLFCFPVGLSVLLLIQTTRPSHLMSALTAMRLPTGVVIAVTAFFRFLPTVQEEWVGIRKAMAFRGISLNLLSVVRAPRRTVEYILVPLLFSSIAVMEELASACMARGMDSTRARSSYEQVRLGAADYAVATIFLVLAGYVIGYGKTGA